MSETNRKTVRNCSDCSAAVVLTLADSGEGPPLEIKLRRLLKIAGRTLGLRCIDVKEIQPPAVPAGVTNELLRKRKQPT